MPTSDLTCELISQLANYREEGLPLRPKVFIANDLKAMLGQFGGSEPVPLGSGPCSPSTAQSILKHCAGLCGSSWCIFVERGPKGDSCTYGVFAIRPDPSAVAPYENIEMFADPLLPIVLIEQSAPNVVDIKTSMGRHRRFYFSAKEIEAATGDDYVARLSGAIARDVGSELREEMVGYLTRTITLALELSHGALIAVLDGPVSTPPEFLREPVLLDEALSLAARIESHKRENSVQSLMALQQASQLVLGMIASDGVTIFRTDGTVLGFRAIVQDQEHAKAKLAGGARTKAYASLKRHLGKGLAGVLFRSQDGRMEVDIPG